MLYFAFTSVPLIKSVASSRPQPLFISSGKNIAAMIYDCAFPRLSVKGETKNKPGKSGQDTSKKWVRRDFSGQFSMINKVDDAGLLH